MSDRVEQIAKLISDAEREAYARGYADAIAAVTAAASAAAKPITMSDSAAIDSANVRPPVVVVQRGRPATKAIVAVRDAVTAKPGLTGVELFRTLEAEGNPILERTMRSCLRRLRDTKVIWQRKKRWYPRPKETPELQSRGEALSTPPH